MAFCLGGTIVPARGDGLYLLQDLGALPGGSSSRGAAINDSGTATGSADGTDGFYHAFQSGSGGSLSDVGTLGGRSSQGRAINASGWIAGESQLGTSQGQATRGFLSGPDGKDMTVLDGFQGGGGWSTAFGLNDGNLVVGAARDGSGNLRAALWGSQGGPATDLGTLSGFGQSQANGVNNDGVIVGVSDSSTFVRRATRWRSVNGNWVLDDLGCLIQGGASLATAINEGGEVAGYGSSTLGLNHAFLYEDGVGMRDIHDSSAFAGSSSYGLAINNDGTVVGQLFRGVDDSRAFVWSADLGMRDLNAMLDSTTGQGWALTMATGINSAGQIVGIGRYNGRERAFLLSPTSAQAVPEPASVGLAAFGLLLVAVPRLRARWRTRGRRSP